MGADKYQRFEDLAAAERPDSFAIRIGRVESDILILAPHGGGIEPGTSEIAAAIASTDFSLYVFEGLKRNNNTDLHITSHRFDEPQCLAILETVDRVIGVHGEGGEEDAVYVGGLDEQCVNHVLRHLNASAFRATRVETGHLAARDPNNLCNRGRTGAGVQLEIGHTLRRTFFRSLTRAGRSIITERFTTFVDAVRNALSEVRPDRIPT